MPGSRVEIVGGIASGKSSLASALAKAGLVASFEDFQRNPFYEAFYEDPAGNAFETEITFLLQHFNQLKNESARRSAAIFDFGLALDLAYSRVTLSNRDQQIFDGVFGAVVEKLGPPSIVVRLRCSAPVEQRRIRARGRAAERGIELRYLERLESELDEALAKAPFANVQSAEIDSERINFVDDPGGIQAAVQIVAKALSVAAQ
jgi:deoxyadenosine/deoxycytidine kinase